MTMTPSLPSPRWAAFQEREHALLERARRGDNVRDEFILHLRPLISRMAERFSQRLLPQARAAKGADPDDLTSAAVLRMLEKYPRALTQAHPARWLLVVARHAMFDVLNGRGDAIKREPDQPPFAVLSLDAPLPGGDTLADQLPYHLHLPTSCAQQAFEALEHAISALPGRQRTVIERFFGFHEHAPTPLRQLSREFSPNSARPCIADYHYRQALITLRHTLASAFPFATTVGGEQ